MRKASDCPSVLLWDNEFTHCHHGAISLVWPLPHYLTPPVQLACGTVHKPVSVCFCSPNIVSPDLSFVPWLGLSGHGARGPHESL